MSDIVKRLRNEAPDDGYGLCCEAADEIERLREGLKQEAERHTKALAEIQRLLAAISALRFAALENAQLQAENKRLRSSLQAMHDEFGANFPFGESSVVDGAREALRVKNG